MKLTLAEAFELVMVLPKFTFVNLDGVSLKSSEKLAVKRNGFVAELLVDEVFDLFGPRNDDGDLLILDELKFIGSGSVVEEKRKVFVPRVFEVAKDVFAVPPGTLLVVVFVEVGLDGFGRERIVGVEVQDFVTDVGGLRKVPFGSRVFRMKNMGLSVCLECSLAVATSGCLGNRIEACHGTVDEREVDIDTRLDQLGRNEADGEFVSETLADR